MADEIASMPFVRRPRSLEVIRQSLAASRAPIPWLPEQFLATKWVEGLLFGAVLGVFVFVLAGPLAALAMAMLVFVMYPPLAVASLKSHAVKRLQQIRMRLPFAVDLIALMMEAGASFSDSIVTVANENRYHPVGQEFSDILRQVSLGRTRKEALLSMSDRLRDETISDFAFAITKGEELGTPLAGILRNQADQMRLKRLQWGEKAAAEAQVKIVFPGMLVMIACLLVVIAPIVLPAVLMLFQD